MRLVKGKLMAALWVAGTLSFVVLLASFNDSFGINRRQAAIFSLNNHRRLLDRSEAATILTQANFTIRRNGLQRPIGFLKIHKAASTTVQGIFLRYGWKKNLTFVLPPEFNPFGYPNIISLNESVTSYNTVPPPPGRDFDILCHHVVYNPQAWSSVLSSDALLVGTVREPFSHFRSSLNYFNPPSISRLAEHTRDPVGTYMKNPLHYDRHSLRYSFINNRQSFEYGVDSKIILNRDFDAFNEYVEGVLNNKFILVLVSERLDESLVLMRRKLNWTFTEIMYATKNVRSPKRSQRYELNDTHKEKHKHFAVFDYLLYEFFVSKLDQEIEKQDLSFKKEVEHFKATRPKVEGYCQFGFKINPTFTIRKSEFNEEFIVSQSDCTRMHKSEIEFTQEIRKRQYGKAYWSIATFISRKI